MSKKEDAIAYNERGNTCREAGNWQAAVELYEQAAALAPKWSSPHYNLGLVYKYQNRWAEAIDCNRRAVKLDKKDEAAWWNLGIAATALGDWPTARAAWTGFGIKLPKGDGPLDFPCGFGPVRLNPDGEHVEVVWADRLCPARMRIVSIPLPESEHRFRDVVLNDGAPVGYRKYQGQEVPVFNALQRLEVSPYGTYLVEVETPDAGTLDQLGKLAVARQMAVEDWTTGIHFICKACSEGRPHDHHDHEQALPQNVHRIAIAGTGRADVTAVLSEWQSQFTDGDLGRVEELLPPPA